MPKYTVSQVVGSLKLNGTFDEAARVGGSMPLNDFNAGIVAGILVGTKSTLDFLGPRLVGCFQSDSLELIKDTINDAASLRNTINSCVVAVTDWEADSNGDARTTPYTDDEIAAASQAELVSLDDSVGSEIDGYDQAALIRLLAAILDDDEQDNEQDENSTPAVKGE